MWTDMPSSRHGQLSGQSIADHEFDRARRAAFIQDILAPLRNEPTDLLPFEEVHSKLRLGSQTYQGLQSVPLDQIVGSVGRYHDFSRAFRPRRESLRPRWQRAMRLKQRLPPIDLYKVGEVYFVVDGNHRVSVARQAGAHTIPAHVWEFKTRVPVESNDDLNDIFIRQEYLEFLEQSHLDINRPEQRIVFTVPGRYRQLGDEIAQHREWLDRQHVYAVSFEEAAADWYDTEYLPMVDIIRQQKILAEFPGRTEADLVAYILRYRGELQEQWLDLPAVPAPSLIESSPSEISPESDEPRRRYEQAAQEFAERTRRDWWGRFVAWIKRYILRWQILDDKPRDDPP
jgi:hypothetical protein